MKKLFPEFGIGTFEIFGLKSFTTLIQISAALCSRSPLEEKTMAVQGSMDASFCEDIIRAGWHRGLPNGSQIIVEGSQ